MEITELKSAIESLLFVSSKPLKIKEFQKLLEQEGFKIQAALDQLVAERKESGVVVLDNNGEYQLATNSKNSTLVKNFLNADLREKLTDATLEVLAIIAYRQPISKAEIEAIRGVNSQYSIRHLLMRGLIEKLQNPNDARSWIYQTTTEFLQHMGLSSIKDLPSFDDLVSQIKLPETPAITSQQTGAEEQQPVPEENETVVVLTEAIQVPETGSVTVTETVPGEPAPEQVVAIAEEQASVPQAETYENGNGNEDDMEDDEGDEDEEDEEK